MLTPLPTVTRYQNGKIFMHPRFFNAILLFDRMSPSVNSLLHFFTPCKPAPTGLNWCENRPNRSVGGWGRCTFDGNSWLGNTGSRRFGLIILNDFAFNGTSIRCRWHFCSWATGTSQSVVFRFLRSRAVGSGSTFRWDNNVECRFTFLRYLPRQNYRCRFIDRRRMFQWNLFGYMRIGFVDLRDYGGIASCYNKYRRNRSTC